MVIIPKDTLEIKEEKKTFVHKLLHYSGAFFWLVAYILIIRYSIIDKTYGMPAIALAFNLSWEFLLGFVFKDKIKNKLVYISWFIVDVFIFYFYWKYGISTFLPNMPGLASYLGFFGITTFSIFFIVVITNELEEARSKGIYAGFIQNLLMSILFIHFILVRNNLSGQSIYIGIAKMLATLLISIGTYRLYPKFGILKFFYISIFIFDIIYIILIYFKSIELNINPWNCF